MEFLLGQRRKIHEKERMLGEQILALIDSLGDRIKTKKSTDCAAQFAQLLSAYSSLISAAAYGTVLWRMSKPYYETRAHLLTTEDAAALIARFPDLSAPLQACLDLDDELRQMVPQPAVQ